MSAAIRAAGACLAIVLWAGVAHAQTTGPCGASAYLTYEDGRLAAVDWVAAHGGTVTSRSELTQSAIISATVSADADGSTPRTIASFSMAGETPATPVRHVLPPGFIYWSDMVPSSVQQAVYRARALGAAAVHVSAQSLFSSARGVVDVRRLDDVDWTVAYHRKTYDVLTDARGCLLAASLPEYGVTIERRRWFSQASYPMWAPYAAPPDRAYAATGVRISAARGAVLAGTLTRPPGRIPVAAAVLITGLSQSERNNGAPPWMPLRDIADALTRSGIAVLRVDDRGIGASTGAAKTFTTFDKADDVRAEVRWLRAQPGIDPRRILLVGYSEGGLIAPMVAASDASIAGIVTLAGPGVTGWDVARYQIAAAVDNDPTIAPADRAAEIAKQLAEPLDPHERSFVGIDPMAYARRVRCPALIVQGATDVTVPLRSAERLAEAMRANGDADVTVRLFPNVSHALLPDTFGLPSQWATLPAFITDPQILDLVSRWAAAHVGAPA